MRQPHFQWDFLTSFAVTIYSMPPAGKTSLQQHITGGRPSELSAWNGVVARLSRRVRGAILLYTFIYNSLLPLELGA
jgi:ketopantoate reductase